MSVRGFHPSQRLMIVANPEGASGCPRTIGEEIQMVFHSNVFEALQELRDAEWDAVLLQLPVHGWSGEELLEEVRRAAPATPCLVQGAPGEDWMQAVRLAKLGACSWLPANATAGDRLGSLQAAFDERLTVRRIAAPDEPWRRFLVGDTAAMRHVVDSIRLGVRAGLPS